MIEISVIVPVYKGKKYIEEIICQIERNSEKFEHGKIELIFVNDYPCERIEPRKSALISVVVFNSDINRGIQGARIKGCELCNGKYIVLLDQDDVITDDYIKSQYENIVRNAADVSVCQAMENGRQIYNAANKFENIGNRDYMLSFINPIVSPGQAMIKKDAIPPIWKNNILEHNGADDWLLWLGLLSDKKKFVLNEKLLFEHIVDGSNTSWNSVNMLLSERDVLTAVKKENIFQNDELQKLNELITTEEFRYIRILEKYRQMFFVYDRWMNLEIKYGGIADHIYNLGYRTVSVYGYGYIGKALTKKIRKSSLNFVSAIDINAEFINEEIKITTLSDFNENVDLIIVTASLSESELDQIRQKAPVLTIQQLLDEWENEAG